VYCSARTVYWAKWAKEVYQPISAACCITYWASTVFRKKLMTYDVQPGNTGKDEHDLLNGGLVPSYNSCQSWEHSDPML